MDILDGYLKTVETTCFRNLHLSFIQRELSVACIGCGRCAVVCHGDIGMPSVVEMIRRATTESDKQ